MESALSFEVYVQCFDRGEPAGIPRASIRPLFPVVEAESEPVLAPLVAFLSVAGRGIVR